MSLINEALKKAQRQRHQAGPVSVGEPVAPPDRPIPPQPPAWRASVVVAATSGSLLIIGAVVFFALRWLEDEPPPAPVVRPAPSKATAPAAPTPTPPPAATPAARPAAPTAVQPAAPTTPAAATARVEPAPAPAPAPARPASSTQTGAVAGTPAPTPAAAAEAAPAPEPNPASIVLPLRAPRPDDRIPAYIESLRVAGVRLLEGDSRVLLNDRVFRLNDIVDRGLGLKLVEARPGTLVFTDANGFRYEKKF